MTEFANKTTECQRCEARCKMDPLPNSEAKMLRRSQTPKGLCVNCAVHDWLRNTYPVNLLLARSGPQALRYPHIQEQFAGIMRIGFADARPDEINWDIIIKNWNLPFPHKMKTGPMNPVTQEELDREPAEETKRQAKFRERIEDPQKKDRELNTVINDEFLPFMRKLKNQK